MHVNMQKRPHIALHVALLAVMLMAVVAPVLLPDIASVAYADDYRRSYEDGFTVYGNNGVTNPSAPMDANAFSCTAPNATASGDAWNIIYDLGQVYQVDEISVAGDVRFVTVSYSVDGNEFVDAETKGSAATDQCPNRWLYPIGSAGVGTQMRYVEFAGHSAFPASTLLLHFFDIHLGTAATPTPSTPTPFPTASPFPPQPTACVTITPTPSATPPRTPTPFSQTPTPGPTSTPITGTATPIPQTGFVSDLAKFDSTLLPWTALASTRVFSVLASWSSVNGPDTLPGTAFLPFTGDYNGVISTTTAPAGAIIFYRAQGFPTPIRLTGNFNSDPVQQFHFNYVRVFYLDPDYNGVGQAAFVHAGIKSISSVWSQLDFTLTPSGGSGRVTAIIVDAVSSGVPFDSPGGLIANGYTYDGRAAGVFADNVKFYAGANAIATSFPTCPGTGGSGTAPIPIKQCKIKAIVTNVYAGCTAPTDALDLAGWITYYFCRLWHYLWFVNENRAQITDILDRQNSNEPIGTLNEMDDSLGVLYETISGISAVYSGNDYYTVDWANLFAGWDNFDFSNITKDWKTSPDPINEQEMLSACPSTFANATNPEVRKGACFISYLLKVKLRWWVLLQYALDASAIIYALSVVLEWLGQHG